MITTTFRFVPIVPSSGTPSPNNPNNPNNHENHTMAYIYDADIFCDDCGKSICQRITAEGFAPDDPDDEGSYDSGEYPKYVDGSSESDSPEHCASGDDCLNSIKFSDGQEIGVWLGNELTSYGEDYTIEAVLEGGDVADLWRGYYDYLDFTITIVCNGCGIDFDIDDVDENNFCIGCQEPDDSDDSA